MIHLGRKSKVRLRKKEVMEIEEELNELSRTCEGLPETVKEDIDNRINRIEFLIQRGRT